MATPLLFAALWGLMAPARAEEPVVAARGSIATHLRVGLVDEEAGQWMDFHDAVVMSGALQRTTSATRVTLDGDARLHGSFFDTAEGASAGITSLDTLQDPSAAQPISLRVRQASVEARGVGVPWLDLHAGAEVLPWGVADGVRLVTPMNPWDAEDPLDLNRRRAVPMLRVLAHPGALSLDAAFAPFFTPAALPPAQVDFLASADDLLNVEGGPTDVRSFETRLTWPEGGLSSSSAAARLGWSGPRVDLGLSGFYGLDTLPQVGGVARLVGFASDATRVDVGVPLTFPRLATAALDLRAPLPADVGLSVEAVACFPERTVVTLDEGQLAALVTLGALDEVPDPLPEVVTQDGAPYVRAVAGVDRSFADHVYVSAQWLHGFPTERTRASLRDYALLTARATLTPTLSLSAQGLTDAQALSAGGELRYLYRDELEVALQGFWQGGDDDSTLAAFRSLSSVGSEVTLTF